MACRIGTLDIFLQSFGCPKTKLLPIEYYPKLNRSILNMVAVLLFPQQARTVTPIGSNERGIFIIPQHRISAGVTTMPHGKEQGIK